jgi:two-component system sensor histidine kinase/response regulator
MVQEVYDIYRVLTDYKQIKLVNLIDRGVNVFADEDMLKTILRNVVSNSVKGDEIKIISISDENTTTIEIIDTGSGIDQGKLAELNEGNKQMLRDSESDQESGTGLGLVLVKDLLEIMNGTLDIKSKLNEGTQIIITLPNKSSE